MNLIDKKNVNEYFGFIQNNISQNGLFIFQIDMEYRVNHIEIYMTILLIIFGK